MTINTEALEGLRRNYKKSTLRKHDCADCPHEQFATWLGHAIDTQCDEPNAFTLSTIQQGRPAARVVLLKGIFKEGPVFYSNYQSPKGRQIMDVPYAAATFLWLPLERQVRIEGRVERVPAEMSDKYFASRPYGSQIGAAASPQGEVVGTREELEKKFSSLEATYPSGPIPRPDNWGGFCLIPSMWEFWQGRENRLHDRIRYRKDEGMNWIKERLAP